MKKIFRVILMAVLVIVLLLPSLSVFADTTITQGSGSSDSNALRATVGTDDLWGQKFLAGHTVIGEYITRLGFRLKKVGSPNGVISFKILDGSNNVKFSTDVISENSLTASYDWYYAIITPTLIAENDWIAVSSNGTTLGANYVKSEYSNADVVSNENGYFHHFGAEYVNGDLIDAIYTLDYSSSSLSVTTNAITLNAGTNNLDFSGTINSLASTNVSTAGFQVALYSANYSDNFSQSVNLGSGETFTDSKSPAFLGLVLGENYKARAFVSDNTNLSYGQDFVFNYAGITPTFSHFSGGYNTEDNHIMLQAVVSATGTANTTPLVVRGFQIGTSSGNYNMAAKYDWPPFLSSNGTALNTDGTGIYGFSFPPSVYSATYYARAFATNAVGITGYSSEISITNPASGLTGLGLTSSVTVYPAPDNYVDLIGNINNQTGFPIFVYRFSWATDNSSDDFFFNSGGTQTNLSGTFLYSSPIGTGNTSSFLPLTTYYFKFGVYINGQWVETEPKSFTTGNVFTTGFSGGSIVTLPVSQKTGTTFTANGTIESLGSSWTAKRGFQVQGGQAGVTAIRTFSVSGNFTTGQYALTLGHFDKDALLYFRAYMLMVTNEEIVGQWLAVQLVTTGDTPDGQPPSVATDFSGVMRDWLDNIGMDNPTGHWAAMLFLQLIFSFVFIPILIVLRGDDKSLERKAISLVWLIVALGIFGAFVFSGLLGVWTIAILVIGAVGAIYLIIISPFIKSMQGGE